MILKNAWRKVLFFSTGGLLIASLAPLLGDFVPGLELFAHFKVHYAVASAFLAVLAFKMRSHGVAIAALILVAVNVVAVVPSFITASVAAGTTNIKVINLNVFEDNPSPGSVIDFLRHKNADIVVLEEVTPGLVKMLKTLADVYPHMLFCDNTPTCDLTLLSKMPWRSAEIRNLSLTGPFVAVAQYDVNGFRFTLLGTHLDRPALPLPNEREHFHHRQVEKLSAMLQRIEGPLVVVGDFNATQWSPSFDKIIKGTGLKRVDGGILPTWPSQFSYLGIPIDQILITEEFTGSTMTVGPQVNSDHLPLIAILGIKE
ncbi:MAG: endonuclease/exonuclease/phosphatase family protein [Rhodospirillales bacterium]|nr:endonuclease/exonuclease/phosphatase family protein [Rhodospirillales bacterium]